MPSGLTEKCDQALGWVCKFWNVSTPEQRVRIFLFPSENSHQRFAQDERSAGSAFPERMSISLVTGEWDHIAETIAHELSHVVVYHRIAGDLPALLDEGMAVMCESEFVDAHGLEGSNNLPRLSPGLSLMELADSDVFLGESVETLWVNYPHAGAFVRDLVKEHGVDKFKEFCRVISSRRTEEWIWGDEAFQLADAFEKTYGIPLADWESEWTKRRVKDPQTDQQE